MTIKPLYFTTHEALEVTLNRLPENLSRKDLLVDKKGMIYLASDIFNAPDESLEKTELLFRSKTAESFYSAKEVKEIYTQGREAQEKLLYSKDLADILEKLRNELSVKEALSELAFDCPICYEEYTTPVLGSRDYSYDYACLQSYGKGEIIIQDPTTQQPLEYYLLNKPLIHLMLLKHNAAEEQRGNKPNSEIINILRKFIDSLQQTFKKAKPPIYEFLSPSRNQRKRRKKLVKTHKKRFSYLSLEELVKKRNELKSEFNEKEFMDEILRLQMELYNRGLISLIGSWNDFSMISVIWGIAVPAIYFIAGHSLTEGLIQSVGPTRAALLNVFLIIFLCVLPLFIRRCLSRSDNVDPLESLRNEIASRLKQYDENKALLYSIEELYL
ncbi:hypothetical protein [Coxiella burnetii]|nr:hypothetical protein [Coxiella burnetii]